MGSFTPWRDAGRFGGAAGITFGADGFTPADGEENPRARLRIVAPDFFHVMGVPLLAGRDFTPDDRRGSGAGRDRQPEPRASGIYPNGEALNHKMWWIDPYFGPKPFPRRIVGIVGDVDDERIARGAGDDGVSPAAADGRGRPAVRARVGRSVCAGAADHARHPGPVGESAGRARRHARGCARRSARARAAQRVCVLRIRRRRAADRRRRRRRRARVRRQRADARVRRAAGDRLDAVSAVDEGARPRAR